MIPNQVKFVNTDNYGKGAMNMEKLTLTVVETAKILGIGRQLAYEKVKTGEIPVIKIGRRLLVPRRALEKLLEQGQIIRSVHSKD
jgi:excisionase family DNA binding protein